MPKSLLEHLYKSPKIAALEITEINPLIDQNNKMAKAALDIMRHFWRNIVYLSELMVKETAQTAGFNIVNVLSLVNYYITFKENY